VTQRRLLVPEVLQSSLMDCGPAALQAVLQGFGIDVGYDALRERCETDVDGTSIDALDALAREFGLESRELLVSRDSFLLPQARCLPAIAMTRSGGGLLHFVVVWRTCGPFVQIMDPTSGRHWLPKLVFLEGSMTDTAVLLSADKWRRWAETADALLPLRERMRRLGIRGRTADELIDAAQRDPAWRGFATLDAGVRMLSALVATRTVDRGTRAARLLRSVCERTLAEASGSPVAEQLIPCRYFWATDQASPTEGKLVLRGSVIVHFARRWSEGPMPALASRGPGQDADRSGPLSDLEDPLRLPGAGLPVGVRRVLAARSPAPMRVLWEMVRSDSRRMLALLMVGLVVSACIVPAEIVLLRSLLGAGHYLALGYQLLGGIATIVALEASALALDLWTGAAARRIGLGLEIRLRSALLEKLPRLDDKYLRSRPQSDTAARGHTMHLMHEVPVLWAHAMRGLLALLATAAGMVWLHPQGAAWTLALTLTALFTPHLSRRSLTELTTRLRAHLSALERFYLDALLGAGPIRVHGAERAVRCEHEELLTEWARTARSLQSRNAIWHSLQLALGTAIAIVLVLTHLETRSDATGLLLLVFWALRLPSSAQELSQVALTLRNLRSVALRLLAPLAAPAAPDPDCASARPAPLKSQSLSIALQRVTVRSGGHTLLRDVDLEVSAGSHVGIVGASGAGKSTLLGLLQGWLVASEGSVCVGGAPLDVNALTRLRDELAWVDPAVHLWERTLYDNLVFGDDGSAQRNMPAVISRADLIEVLQTLPDGMQSNLGEGGAKVSGGQGQRVRFGRALMRPRAGLVLLDEPFRGLEREKRRELLRRSREHWRDATLLFVSHDIGDTLELDRVIVVDSGRVVEQGAPAALMADSNSRYRVLVTAEQSLRAELWSTARWRQAWVEKGRISESASE
jgi:ABC-type bacteriocin/lantibiotic exporter with double-glycine peptidase domain